MSMKSAVQHNTLNTSVFMFFILLVLD